MRLLLALLVASVLACSSSSNDLPPVTPEDIQVFMPGESPSFDFEEITRLTMVGTGVIDEVVERAKWEARDRRMRVDGVLIRHTVGRWSGRQSGWYWHKQVIAIYIKRTKE